MNEIRNGQKRHTHTNVSEQKIEKNHQMNKVYLNFALDASPFAIQRHFYAETYALQIANDVLDDTIIVH